MEPVNQTSVPVWARTAVVAVAVMSVYDVEPADVVGKATVES